MDEVERLCKLVKEQLDIFKCRIIEKYEGLRENVERELQIIEVRRKSWEEERKE